MITVAARAKRGILAAPRHSNKNTARTLVATGIAAIITKPDDCEHTGKRSALIEVWIR